MSSAAAAARTFQNRLEPAGWANNTIHSKPLSVVSVFFLGPVGFGTIPPLQMYVMKKAVGAPMLAPAANISAFNLGASGGVWLGGIAINAGYGFTSPNWVGEVKP
jgi:DHA1 family inner membrane transport protein